jgi:hypothetical protein
LVSGEAARDELAEACRLIRAVVADSRIESEPALVRACVHNDQTPPKTAELDLVNAMRCISVVSSERAHMLVMKPNFMRVPLHDESELEESLCLNAS